MGQLVFRNIEPSDLTRAFVEERLTQLTEKFPDLRRQHMRITLAMENSPVHTGPDLFTIRLWVGSGRYRGIRLEKSSEHFYRALADLVDAMLERLNRWGDRVRVRDRHLQRHFNRSMGLLPTLAVREDEEDDEFYIFDDRRAMP